MSKCQASQRTSLYSPSWSASCWLPGPACSRIPSGWLPSAAPLWSCTSALPAAAPETCSLLAPTLPAASSTQAGWQCKLLLLLLRRTDCRRGFLAGLCPSSALLGLSLSTCTQQVDFGHPFQAQCYDHTPHSHNKVTHTTNSIICLCEIIYAKRKLMSLLLCIALLWFPNTSAYPSSDNDCSAFCQQITVKLSPRAHPGCRQPGVATQQHS